MEGRPMSEREMLLGMWEREFPTTMKVLRAYPAGKGDFKPHERSKSAKELAWTFVVEEQVGIAGALAGSIDFSKVPPPPATLAEAIGAFEKSHRELVAKFKAASDATLSKPIKFPVGPNKVADLRTMDVIWGMVMDSIHHRGQLSVYVRMAGGKVPSIYGPSADEPWM
jgi:uncharacterized damage-inducible protein DinB